MDEVVVQCVYGNANIRHLEDCLIPGLSKASSKPIKFVCMNYSPFGTRIASGFRHGIEVVDIQNTASSNTGFAENHNLIFEKNVVLEHFVILNPDCLVFAGCIDALIKRKYAFKGKVGIVEGRQWPEEHPKEFDTLSLQAPWASGAFALIDAAFYRHVGGMEELYFLYMEDVDLSWQAWLSGFAVLYEPHAVVTHFSGGKFYRQDIVSPEQYFSLRNFVILSAKFFGEKGEAAALAMLSQFHDQMLACKASEDYIANYKNKIPKTYIGKTHEKVKILGLGQFHRIMTL